MPESFTFEEANQPASFTFEEASAEVPAAPPGQGATFGREVAASIAPTIGSALGGVGGFSAGTAAAPSLGPAAPAAPLVGSFMGSLAGGALTELAQSEILKRTSPEFLEQLKAGRSEHPWTSFAARMAAAVPVFTIAPGQTVRGLMALPAVLRQAATQAQKEATKAAAIQLGMGTAGGVVAPLLHGEAPTVRGVLESTAQAATFGAPRFSGQAPAVRPTPRPERVTVTAEPPAEVAPIQIGRVESVGQKLLTEGTQPSVTREPPVSSGEVPLGVSRPDIYDPSLQKLSERDFDVLYKKTTQEVDRLEKLYDEGQLKDRKSLADVQDKYSSVELERFRRNITGIHPEDLFRDLRREPNDTRAWLLLNELKRQGATPEQMLGSMRAMSPDEAEVFRAQLERIKEVAAKEPVVSEQAPPPMEAPKTTVVELDDFRALIKKSAESPTPKTPEELADLVVKTLGENLPKKGETPGKLLLMEFGVPKSDVMPLTEAEVLSELRAIAQNPEGWGIAPGTYKANQLEYLLKQAGEQAVEQAPAKTELVPPERAKPLTALDRRRMEAESSLWSMQGLSPRFLDALRAIADKRGLSEEQYVSAIEDAVGKLTSIPVNARAETLTHLIAGRSESETPPPAPLSRITQRAAQTQPGEQVARAEPIEAEPVPEPRPPRPPIERRNLIIDPYSTPMLERLDSVGGHVSRQVAAEGRQMDSRRAELIGGISQVLDTAKRLAARAFRGGTTWIRQRGRVTPYAAIGRLHTLEGIDRNAVVAMAPPRAQPMVGALWDANTPAIGGLAAQANVGFAPQGRIQRIPTNRGMDTVLEGGGTLWNRWVEGNAVANNRPVATVQALFRNWKAELDQPVPDVGRLDQIAQDFHRELPRFITHVRLGPKWIEMVESDPVNYLEKAAQRTAAAVAFREVYPATAQGRQNLMAMRQAVQAELPTNRYGKEFDNLINVLQGHRFDVSPKMLATASASPVGALAAEAGGVITRPLRAGMLSLSAIANAAESVIGGPAIFMRFRHVLPLLTKDPRTFSKQLEMTGARDPNIRNFAFNPTKPAESVSRILSEGVSKVTLNSFMNEVQEYTGAAAAKLFADRVRAGDLTVEEQRYFRNVLRAAGFRRNPEAIVQGQDLQGLAQFERQAAPFLSGGADRPATASRWGNSRFFNALFWFHRYPQMVLNQFRGITNNLLEDARRHDWRSLGENALLMAKFLGAKAAQGALANLFVAWVKEQFSGTEQRMREAKQSFGKFVVDSAVTGFGGPLAIATRLFQPRVRNAQDAAVELLKVSAPISSTMDAINAIGGMDKYEGLPAFERTAQLLESKTPITPIVRSVAAIMGLADDNPKLRTARNAFYRWTEKQGWSYPKGQSKDAEFTAGMRRVAKKLETGGDYKAELKKTLIEKAATLREKKRPGDPFTAAAQSLSHRYILRNQFGGQLTAEEIKSLQAWLGPENFQLLQKRDAMIDALSDALKE